jgi:hypothetical protein
MDELGHMDPLVDATAEGQFMSTPVDGLDDGWGPSVALLDVL